ncbi:MAG: hypothetical protein A3E37_05750 [Candidatus Andersenbacteria bacterium RIFCSPHIGHO2_12_FULL_46_9]|nr:MAG: hypothetical protein A3E37_05750 [Candidatus Andersenbacteria bacterium RIFCSPHIGHO2_12_FULL_46_9]HBE89614.1 hypothetical protein [Candidatus Andersenbacteria bacterium]
MMGVYFPAGGEAFPALISTDTFLPAWRALGEPSMGRPHFASTFAKATAFDSEAQPRGADKKATRGTVHIESGALV